MSAAYIRCTSTMRFPRYDSMYFRGQNGLNRHVPRMWLAASNILVTMQASFRNGSTRAAHGKQPKLNSPHAVRREHHRLSAQIGAVRPLSCTNAEEMRRENYYAVRTMLTATIYPSVREAVGGLPTIAVFLRFVFLPLGPAL